MKGPLLKQLVAETGKTQNAVAVDLGISAPSFSLLINRGDWPRRNQAAFRDKLAKYFLDGGADAARITAAMAQLDGGKAVKGTLLKQLIVDCGTHQKAVAAALGVPGSAISVLISRGDWPRREYHAFRRKLRELFLDNGADEETINAAIAQLDDGNIFFKEEIAMISKQTLTPQAKRKFRIPREIFTDEFSDIADVFLSPEIRYVSECLYQLAKHGGMMALVGESGSGKTTLAGCLEERLANEGGNVIVIKPYVLGMDNGNKKANAMKSSHICEAILAALKVPYKGNLSAEGLFKLTHEKLVESSMAGNRHLLEFEEAHSLPRPMIKQLKRFWELKRGVVRLLSILLIGQQELEDKLASTDKDIREMVQRTEIVKLNPLDDLEGYVRHRCERAGASFDSIFAPDALPALALDLIGPKDKRGRGKSTLYPLLVGNRLTKAINKAEDLKMERVTADVIRAA